MADCLVSGKNREARTERREEGRARGVPPGTKLFYQKSRYIKHVRNYLVIYQLIKLSYKFLQCTGKFFMFLVLFLLWQNFYINK